MQLLLGSRDSVHVVAFGDRHPCGEPVLPAVRLRDAQLDAPRITVGNDILADDGIDADRRRSFVEHVSGSIGLRNSDGTRRGSGVQRTIRPALAVAAALALTACEADAIAARATLAEWGYHGIAIQPAPTFGRPCRWGEPFAVRFRAMREDGTAVSGIVCAADENAEDARLLVDAEGSH